MSDTAPLPDRYLQALRDRDLDAVLAMYAPDATLEDPVGSGPVSGTDAIRAFYERGIAMGLDGKRTGPIRKAANTLAFPFHLRIEGSGIAIDVIDVFELGDDGRIIGMKAYWGRENITKLG